MLFRDIQGQLISINRSDYYNDTDYYQAICNINNIYFPKETLEFDRIIKLIENKTTHSS